MWILIEFLAVMAVFYLLRYKLLPRWMSRKSLHLGDAVICTLGMAAILVPPNSWVEIAFAVLYFLEVCSSVKAWRKL